MREASGWRDGDPIAHHAGVRPERLAVVELRTGLRLSYAQLDRTVARTAGWLQARLGRALGERVAYLGRNSADQLAVIFACHRLGAIVQPLNWRLSGAELKGLVEDAGPRLLIYEEEFEAAALEALAGAPDAVAFRIGAEDEALSRTVAAAEPAPAAAVDPDAPFILLYTSGTTGKPKGVVVTRKGAFFSAFNFMSVGQVSAASTMLCDAPMFHTVGLMAVVRTAMQAGAAVAISDRFLPELTLERLSDRALGVTHYFAVPQIAKMLREHPRYAAADFSRLVGLFTGGAPMPPALIERFLDDGVMLANGYGMSEAGTVLCMPLDREIVRARLQSCGRPAPAVEIKIMTREGSEARPGEAGELWLRGPGVTPGYWNQPQANAGSFVDGWFRTGDAGLKDEEGFFQLIDRWKDMYITGGENVYPAEVEAVLATLDGVVEVAVIGAPDERWGECGYAFVVGAGLGPDAVLAHCDGRLARYKHPRGVRFIETLPRTASGKVRKDELRRWLTESLSPSA